MPNVLFIVEQHQNVLIIIIIRHMYKAGWSRLCVYLKTGWETSVNKRKKRKRKAFSTKLKSCILKSLYDHTKATELSLVLCNVTYIFWTVSVLWSQWLARLGEWHPNLLLYQRPLWRPCRQQLAGGHLQSIFCCKKLHALKMIYLSHTQNNTFVFYYCLVGLSGEIEGLVFVEL